MNRSSIIFSYLFFVSVTVCAQQKQEKLVKKADEAFEALSFVRAKNLYETIGKDSMNEPVTQRLAECYYNLNDWEASERLLSKVVRYKEVDPKYYLMYADALKSTGKGGESDQWVQKFREHRADDSRSIRYGESGAIRYISKVKADVKNVPFNSSEADFSPVMYKDQLVFASARKNTPEIIKRSYSWNEKPFLDLYVINPVNDKTQGKGVLFDRALKSRFHDGPVAFNSANTEVYITRNTVEKGKKSGTTVNRLKLYKSTLENNKWTEPHELPFNGNAFNTGHACLSPDGKRLYFVSDRPGGMGGTDIYYVDIVGKNKYSVVKNLGPSLNTEGNEMFPSFDKNGMLFFSSDGHMGYGRLDIFYSIPNKEGEFTQVTNLGSPINSAQDDFGITFGNKYLHGYFSSNRPGGKGDDDIYEFKLEQPLKRQHFVTGRLTASNDQQVKNAVAIIRSEDGTFKDTLRFGTDDQFKIEVAPETRYVIDVQAPGFKPAEINFLVEFEETTDVEVELKSLPGLDLRLIAQDKADNKALAGARVAITNKTLGSLLSFMTSETGELSTRLPGTLGNKEQYSIKIDKTGYLPVYVNLSETISEQSTKELSAELVSPEKGMQIGRFLDITNIHFETGRSDITPTAAAHLDKIVDVLRQFPSMVLEIGTHTDSKGKSSDNLKLSEKRAQACAAYIISQGIPEKNIKGVGYGESKLINRCADGVKCSDLEHQENIRTELKIISL